MIRLGLVYLGCVVTIAALITQGPALSSWYNGTEEEAAAAPKAEVAPAPAAPEAPAAPVAVAAAPKQAPVQPQQPQSNEGAAAALAAAVAASATPEPEPEETAAAQPLVRGGKASLEQTTWAILAEMAIVQEQGDVGEDMLNMSTAAISGLKGVRGADSTEVVTLEKLVANALMGGQPDAQIDQSVNEAASAGLVSVPAELVTPEGRVDTSVLLANLVSQARISAGLAEPVNPAEVVVGGERVEVHLVTKAGGQAEQARFYTVGRGDSLGAIALKFYGDVVYFPKIFEANRGILSSPDKLLVGQRLVIPDVAEL